MRNYAGLAFVVIGAWFAYAGVSRVRPAASASVFASSLRGFTDIMRPIMLLALGYLGLKMAMVFAMMGAGRMFSLFDLAGFETMLAGYGVWFHFRTRAPRAAALHDRADVVQVGMGADRVAGARDRGGRTAVAAPG
jgi:hypothetical protein